MEFQNSSVWKNHQNVTNAVLNAISKAINFTVGESSFITNLLLFQVTLLL